MQPNDIPLGLCQCGCGHETNLATVTRYDRGHVKGQPLAFRKGHRPQWLQNDWTVDSTTNDWMWNGAVLNSGYGVVYHDGVGETAHNWVWKQFRPPIPEGMVLDHLCHVRLCVNPDHLEPVPEPVNSRRHHLTKLDPEKVREIRTLQGSVSARVLAERFGVSRPTIFNIWSGYSWQSVS